MAKVWYIAGGRSESGGSESGSGTSSSRRAGGPGAGTAPRCGGAGRGLPPGSGAGVPEVEVEEEGEEGARAAKGYEDAAHRSAAQQPPSATAMQLRSARWVGTGGRRERGGGPRGGGEGGAGREREGRGERNDNNNVSEGRP